MCAELMGAFAFGCVIDDASTMHGCGLAIPSVDGGRGRYYGCGVAIGADWPSCGRMMPPDAVEAKVAMRWSHVTPK